MTAGWVAGAVRARALGGRRLGRVGARALATSPTLEEAVAALAATPYGHDVRVGMDLAQAQHAVVDSALWNLRVLAGWLPAAGAEAVRVLAGWCEVANVDELLRGLTGSAAEPPYRLGTLATAWPQLSGATSVTDLRERLARSGWGDPGGDTRRDVQLALRLTCARRVAARATLAGPAAVTAVALLLAREGPVHGTRPVADAAAVVGRAAAAAQTLPELASALPADARWVLDGVRGREDLWTAETRWWRRVEEDSFALARSAGFDARPVIGAVGLLTVDAWRVRAALALAGRDDAAEVLDAVA